LSHKVYFHLLCRLIAKRRSAAKFFELPPALAGDISIEIRNGFSQKTSLAKAFMIPPAKAGGKSIT
jgi:hypothetical protein